MAVLRAIAIEPLGQPLAQTDIAQLFAQEHGQQVPVLDAGLLDLVVSMRVILHIVITYIRD